MSKWQQVNLGEAIDILSGYAFKSKDFCDKGVPVLKIQNVTNSGVLLNEDTVFVSEDTAAALLKYKIHYDDILITMTGSNISQFNSVVGRVSKVKFAKPAMLNQRVGKILLKDKDSFCLDYIFYFLSQESTKIKLAQKASGSANQANISPAIIKSLKIPMPPIEVQRKIADVLSAYDDLIENNRKQIKLLEEAAQRLYKEWFIDLRFPGHENTKIINGIPEGWRAGKAIDFFNITIGKTPPRSESQCFTDGNNGIPWISISDMGISGAYAFFTAEGLTADSINKYNVKKVPIGTILLSFKLTIGRVSIATTPCCTNEAIAHFYIDKEWMSEYTYLYLKNFEYDTLGNTSSISKAVNSSIIKSMPFMMPDEDLISTFSKLTAPIFKRIYDAQKSINAAQSARDNLLHKLMNGEWKVNL